MQYNTYFWCLFFYRYSRLLVNCIAVLLYKPIPPPKSPSFTPRDVTVIVPTLEGRGELLVKSLETICRAGPYEIILSTVDKNREKAEETVRSIRESFPIKVTVTSVPNPSKRHQLAVAIEKTVSRIVICADDDVFWRFKSFLKWILAPFEDSRMGGVATRQCLLRPSDMGLFERIWYFLGALYLERRNFDCTATMFMDRGVPCLSGRTLALRTEMVKNPVFLASFLSEQWSGAPLNPDDDNYFTRWIMNHEWKMYFQNHPQAEVQTTLESDLKFLKQCVRWSRSNWRSNLRSLLEWTTWRRYPWSTYTVFLTTPTQLTLMTEPLLIWLCHKTTEADAVLNFPSMVQLLGFIASTKFVKLVSHYRRHPWDLVLSPVSVLFGYFHSLIKIYSAFTLSNV
ncbi:hypothetical protein AJ80_07704 [Polytolypa hystricis UAMH7299]|uniref:Glycosyltransferase 2-like domain-containing protein n=1 Tax=Polytolypa hystricis (strain UAMH7299) TaxID=1447883 RepID=A0A2B7XLF5_POLH7|nr:hypothetical protein AJ80_07704 [Polytolypa hystricis UAMH7299]